MKIQIELSAEREKLLLEEALDGVGSVVRERAEKNSTLRRDLIRDAICKRLP